MHWLKHALRIAIVSASLIVASGVAVGSVEIPGVDALAIAQAYIAAAALGMLGVPAIQDGAVINAGGFLAIVAAPCTGIEVLLVFGAAVLVSPVPLKSRAWALLLGIPALCALNLFRVTSLMLVGIGYPEHFDTAHLAVWQTVMAVVALAIWFFWLKRASGDENARSPSTLR